MSHVRVVLAPLVSLVLVSCGGGGGGGGGGETPPTLTGTFIDGPVQGLAYTSAPSGISGLTGPNGEFQYRSGDRIQFRIGGTFIGDVLGQPQVTPFTVLPRTNVPSVTDEWPVNLAQWLLTLDTVPGNDTITLPATVPALPAGIFFGTSTATFNAGMQGAGIALVPPADAIAHLQKHFAIWGSWASAETPSELQVITFLPDGTFILAHDAAGGVDGMERGSYRWNATTNELTYTVAVNTDGTGGLSNPGASQTPPYTFVIDQSGNSAVFHFGPNVNNQIPLTRVTDATNPLVGAWKLLVDIELGFTAVLTFLPNGTFMVASDAIDTAPAGMERGTYTVDQAGNVTFNTTVDTNGDFGVNDSPILPAVSTQPTQISTDILQFNDPTGPAVFGRVRVP